MKKKDLNYQELKFILKGQGIDVRPSYTHDDYIFTSFTMPYPLKNKIDRVCKKYGITRSKFIQLLVDSADEKDLLKYLDII